MWSGARRGDREEGVFLLRGAQSGDAGGVAPEKWEGFAETLRRLRREGPFRVTFLLVEGFSMMALSSAIEPLRAANRLLGAQRYEWTLAADHAGLIAASNGIEIKAQHGVDTASETDLTVVVASLFPKDYQAPRTFAWLRRLRARGRLLGAISSGALLLARAGVLHNTRVTIHWETARELEKSFPDLDVSQELYCWDRGILTAAGGAAAMDMMLALITQIDGEDLAIDVANQFLHGPIRPSSHAQHEDLRWRFRITDERLLAAIKIMKRRLSDPVRIAAIAEQVGISERQLERLFLAEVEKLPSEFYMGLRLQAARGMLLASTESLETIAEQCGFSSLGHFSRSFKARFGESPSVARRRRPRGHGGFVQEDGELP